MGDGADHASADALAAENETLRRELRVLNVRVAELERLVDWDTLTPLLNRRAFLREVERSIARVARHNASIAVMIGDLDGLKAVNDTRGHGAGDALLVHVGYTLKVQSRATDVVARIGGDEFGMILEAVDERAAADKAEALRRAVAEEMVEGVTPSISIGAALIRADDTLDTIVARADAAMYASKNAQRSAR